jgi:hypothetical protein
VSDVRPEELSGSRLLSMIQTIVISPAKAKRIVAQYRTQAPKDAKRQQQERIADQIIVRYARRAAVVGGGSSLPGVVPGIGTVVAATGGTAVNTVACIKLQVDMCLCLAETFDYDITREDARNLAFLVAAGATLEKADLEGVVRFASQAGVRLLKRYLQRATLQIAQKLFERVAIALAGQALAKSLPFGLGVVVGGSTSFARTRRTGRQAKAWFLLDRSLDEQVVAIRPWTAEG